MAGRTMPLGKSAETHDLVLLDQGLRSSGTPTKSQPQGVDSDERDTYV